MFNLLNIVTKISLFFFNFILECKYKIKTLLFKIHQKNDTEIEDAYFINTETNAVIELKNRKIINDLNHLLKFSKYVPVDKIVETSECFLNINEKYLVEIMFQKHNRKYLFNFYANEKHIYFPTYNHNEMKEKNMNKITEIDSEEEKELLDIILKYGGPLNDFYVSKNLGIPLSRFYSKKLKCFPFKDKTINLSDIFLNEYKDVNSDSILAMKHTLDKSKISDKNPNEQYILSKYKKISLDGKMIIEGIFNWIFGKQKDS